MHVLLLLISIMYGGGNGETKWRLCVYVYVA